MCVSRWGMGAYQVRTRWLRITKLSVGSNNWKSNFFGTYGDGMIQILIQQKIQGDTSCRKEMVFIRTNRSKFNEDHALAILLLGITTKSFVTSHGLFKAINCRPLRNNTFILPKCVSIQKSIGNNSIEKTRTSFPPLKLR